MALTSPVLLKKTVYVTIFILHSLFSIVGLQSSTRTHYSIPSFLTDFPDFLDMLECQKSYVVLLPVVILEIIWCQLSLSSFNVIYSFWHTLLVGFLLNYRRSNSKLIFSLQFFMNIFLYSCRFNRKLLLYYLTSIAIIIA